MSGLSFLAIGTEAFKLDLLACDPVAFGQVGCKRYDSVFKAYGLAAFGTAKMRMALQMRAVVGEFVMPCAVL